MKKLHLACCAAVIAFNLNLHGAPIISLPFAFTTDGSFGTYSYAGFSFGVHESTNPKDGSPTYTIFSRIPLTPSNVGDVYSISSSSDDPNFDPLVSALTSGQNYYYESTMALATAPPPASNWAIVTGVADPASTLFGGISRGWPDLRGYDIESFSLTVDSLTPQNLSGTQISGQFTVTIYGQPIPEPSFCGLMILGIAAWVQRPAVQIMKRIGLRVRRPGVENRAFRRDQGRDSN